MAKPAPIKEVVNILDDYQKAVSAEPQSAAAQSNLGWGYYGKGHFEQAVAQFEKVLAIDPNNFDALFGSGLAHRRHNNSQAALAAFKRAQTVAEGMENSSRSHMLLRMVHAQINYLTSGDWKIGAELWHAAN